MCRPSLSELETLTPPEDIPDDARITVHAGDLRALVALIPAARELERTFGSYVVPEQGAQHGNG